ncbi:hypothetical protein CPT_Moby_203 [Stenotrophomonas phage Moby]|uniref:Uncharacterized protein n=1 Tax=Stenotrophomonas phage Moby TaxID=2601680 RepID=A0A5P8PMG1_9CAUD|nr:hypothetical protein HWC58_gp195 [Stenotrophomonas phage Moby]QFR57928.1 hypothetical protein CPT_Moby_203 [Stenotrophomonas phage Moby]QXN67285.1 hypothetical protein [Stenotrophomonas phage BUCT608]QYC97422.1 hypothetical protein [Stenotrophomonas phage BUCT608]
MFQLTTDPDVIYNEETCQYIPRGHPLWDTYEEFVLGGGIVKPVAPRYGEYTPEHFRYIRSMTWEWMSSWVKARRYDSIESCVGYVSSSVERYKAEATCMVAWRDAVNMKLEEMVLNPPPGISTWEQVRVLLPQPESYPWPGLVDIPMGKPGDDLTAPLIEVP